MTTIYKNFDFNPAAISVKTTNYTIPEGRYARVIANVEGSASFNINGSLALRGAQNSVLATSPLLLAKGGSGASGITAQSTSAAGIEAAFSSQTDQKPLVQDFWVPQGTIISGSGSWRAVVEEYEIYK